MIKTYRLKNLLMAGQITGPELEALLQKRDYLGALYDLRNDKVWMADIAQSPMAMAAVVASETALVAVVASETVMAAVAASETALAAVVASETVMAAVNNSLIAKNAFFVSPKKRTVSVGNNSWNWQNIANGRGVFVRYQGRQHDNNKLSVDDTKYFAVEGEDFFKIIPYTSNLQIYRYYYGATVHYIPIGA